jgi:hypothetical protein
LQRQVNNEVSVRGQDEVDAVASQLRNAEKELSTIRDERQRLRDIRLQRPTPKPEKKRSRFARKTPAAKTTRGSSESNTLQQNVALMLLGCVVLLAAVAAFAARRVMDARFRHKKDDNSPLKPN